MNRHEKKNEKPASALLRDSGITISSIILVLAGAILIRYPESALRWLCLSLGIFFLALGIVQLLTYMSGRRLHGMFNLPSGVVMTIVGLVLITSPGLIISMIHFVVGMILLILSLVKIRQAFDLKRVGYDNWWSMLMVGIIMLAIGGYVVLWPLDSAVRTTQIIGVALIAGGVLSACGNIFAGITVDHYAKASYRDKETNETAEAEILDRDGNVIN